MARAGGLPLPTITDDRALGAVDIQRSLRFNYNNNVYLSRTPSSAGNRKTFTISAWVKRNNIGSVHPIFSRYTANSEAGFLGLYINSDDNIYFTGWSTVYFKSNRLYRDVTSWSNIVCVVDTTQSTSTDRVKLYFNGELQTLATYNAPSQNADLNINEASAEHMIGRYSTNYMDGYMTEVNFIDGQALDSSYFGFTDSQTGIWMPKRYEGTYGTNGFYFDFSDNSSTAALGIDKSPNGNDFTANNFSVSAGTGNDSVTDTPTNNFCTLNSLDKSTNATFSNGNLKLAAMGGGNNYDGFRANFGSKTGKYYWEVKFPNVGYITGIGIARADGLITAGNQPTYRIVLGLGSWFNTYNSGNVNTYVNANVSSDYGNWSGASNYSTNDVYMIAVDFSAGKIWWGKNGSWFNNSGTANPATGADPRITFTTGNEWFPYSQEGNYTTSLQEYNFGQQGFAYTPPTGYKTLRTKNLAPNSPSIVRPQRHFDTVLYTGNSSTQKITGLEFKPDMIWFKSRTSTNGHGIVDSVRGRSKIFYPDTNQDEDTSSSNRDLASFDDGGFTLGNPENLGSTNNNGLSIVAWCWKAGGATTVSNTDGNQTTQVSVNEEAGFSIVTYTGTGSNTNIGHGLGAVPDMIITKSRSAAGDWAVLDKFNTTAEYGFFLNDNGGYSSYQGGTYWNDTPPTSTVFRVSSNAATNASGVTYMAYCWTSIPGYSKIGKYSGNSSSDGAYVHLGFRPAWVLFKRNDSGGNWFIVDNKRDVHNECTRDLYPNTNGTETNNPNFVDFLSDGFKLRTTGSSVNAGTIVYMAFAEQSGKTPFETVSNAR